MILGWFVGLVKLCQDS